MENYIVGAIIIVVLGIAIAYIVKAKKSGVKCIGCPAAGQCSKGGSSKCSGECSCHADIN